MNDKLLVILDFQIYSKNVVLKSIENLFYNKTNSYNPIKAVLDGWKFGNVNLVMTIW